MTPLQQRVNCRACGKEFLQPLNKGTGNGQRQSYCAECRAALVGNKSTDASNNGNVNSCNLEEKLMAGNNRKKRKRKARQGSRNSGKVGKRRKSQKGNSQRPFWQVVCCVCKKVFFTYKEPPKRELVQCPQCFRERVERFKRQQQSP